MSSSTSPMKCPVCAQSGMLEVTSSGDQDFVCEWCGFGYANELDSSDGELRVVETTWYPIDDNGKVMRPTKSQPILERRIAELKDKLKHYEKKFRQRELSMARKTK